MAERQILKLGNPNLRLKAKAYSSKLIGSTVFLQIVSPAIEYLAGYFCGPVALATDHPLYLGATRANSQTAEHTAVIWIVNTT